MNHLAHCFLSFGHEEWLLGNFIGDYVKGNDWENYPDGIRKGILLHRTIDSFTDSHPLVHEQSARLRPFAGRFAGPIGDILFDHLLARAWGAYTNQPFTEFTMETYTLLTKNAHLMPSVLSDRLPRMVEGDFLKGYGYREGLEFVFGKFAQRLPAPIDYEGMLDYFFFQLPEFEKDFSAFFPELLNKCKDYLADSLPRNH